MIPVRLQTVRRLLRKHRRRTSVPACLLLLFAVALTPLAAQSTPYINRNLILLDPAHGGQDNGVNFNGQSEKNLTLDIAETLKSLLTARGFTVVATRDGELPPTAPLLTPEQRAGTANHLRPAACILLHATSAGSGVHLITSTLEPSLVPYEPSIPLPWDTAQSLYVPQSRSLANAIGLALQRARIPVLLVRATVQPLDHLTCPALAVEIAPLTHSGQRPTLPTDTFYQQRVADALAEAILAWRDANLPKPEPAKPAGANP